MNREKLWEKFYETGTIADYLEYCATAEDKEHKDADNDRGSAERASCRGTG